MPQTQATTAHIYASHETNFAGQKDVWEQFSHLQFSEDMDFFFFRDEAHFELNGYEDKQNTHYSSADISNW